MRNDADNNLYEFTVFCFGSLVILDVARCYLWLNMVIHVIYKYKNM